MQVQGHFPRLQELAVVPEWIAEDSASGETFNHSEVVEVPNLPMDDIEVFFLAEDPQVRILKAISFNLSYWHSKKNLPIEGTHGWL